MNNADLTIVYDLKIKLTQVISEQEGLTTNRLFQALKEIINEVKSGRIELQGF